jgi:lambda repressor-like predicted transcriptional regulator
MMWDSGSMHKKASKEMDRAEVLRRLEGSGQSMAQFCREQGLAYWTVAEWRRKARRQRPVEWVEVEPVGGELARLGPQAAVGNGALAAELALPGGAVLRIYREARESC